MMRHSRLYRVTLSLVLCMTLLLALPNGSYAQIMPGGSGGGLGGGGATGSSGSSGIGQGLGGNGGGGGGGGLGNSIPTPGNATQAGAGNGVLTGMNGNGTNKDSPVCTSFIERAQELDNNNGGPQKEGMLSDIYKFIKTTVNDATEKLFTSFTQSTSYKSALYGAVTLMIIFYGVGFTMGVVQPSFQQVLVRLIKIGIVFTLVSPSGWEFFNENIVTFFQDGTDDLIKGVQSISMGPPPSGSSTPFYALDRLFEFLAQPDTIIALMGSMMTGGPFGLTMSALMMLASYGFFMLILKTLRIYAVTFVARALILGVGPIFFVFLLFDRTRDMFMAWVNALVNLSLQPILLFTFLSFFMVLMQSAAKDMLGTELCWQEFKSVSGSSNKLSFWVYADKDGNTTSSEMTWQGSLECLLSPDKTKKCPAFPVNIVDVLSFLILVYLAQRFTDVVEKISSELSNAYVALDSQGKLEQIMQSQGQSGGGFGGSLNPKAGGQTGKGKRR